ncbi:hypothetical protein BDW59DRAFT_125810 [Aspergillus cavernicola]|uniref:Zn(2)-C6 fungal-type domain-containing protein n=1 Tax=Aspergillus cavernicola TaxID=176166 RepID=A0ABR4IW81_9EURO
MVGVPGRSKACVTCLKRKKRCDLEKPSCGTCRKARVECGGYHRPRIFINNTIENQNQHLGRKDRGASRSDTDRGYSTSRSDIALIPTLAHSAYQTKYQELWWRLYLPNGQALSTEVTHMALGGWLDAVHGLHTAEPVLKQALMAMSLTAVGRQENDRFLLEEGRKCYGSSLQGMTVALKNPRRATSDALLTAVRLCSFYESIFGGESESGVQARSWQAHNAGDVALIMARSPYSFVSGYAHELFADGRSNLTMSHLRHRKRVFLADLEWKTIPWLYHEKTPRDHLVDVLVDLTGLFEDLDLMKSCQDMYEKEIARQNLIDRFLQLNQDLLTWQALYAPDFQPRDELPGSVPPQDLVGAHLMTTFWATAIISSGNLRGLWYPGEEFDLGPDLDLDLFCGNIVRTFPFFNHPSMGLFRAHIYTFPMTVAIHYICAAGPSRLVEERRLLADCLYDPACAGVRKFITSLKDAAPLEFLN